jgi:hypothetical protein
MTITSLESNQWSYSGEGARVEYHPDFLQTACPYMGVIFTWQGFSKAPARLQQRPSKDDFSKNHTFGSLLTPIYGNHFFTNELTSP